MSVLASFDPACSDTRRVLHAPLLVRAAPFARPYAPSEIRLVRPRDRLFSTSGGQQTASG